MEIELSNDGEWKETALIDNEDCLFSYYRKVDGDWEVEGSYSIDLEHIKRIAEEVG